MPDFVRTLTKGLLAVLLGLTAVGCRNTSPAAKTDLSIEAAARHHEWSNHVELTGVPNSRQVSEGLYRGAQPSAEGFKSLQQLGVKTVVNLRGNDSDLNRMPAGVFCYHRIPMDGFHPQTQHIIDFLRIVSDPTRQPVFLHCQHGADRTGLLVAMYRVVIEGWTREQAIAEMTQGGTKFHALYGNLADFVREADIVAIRAELANSRLAAQD